MKRSILLCLLSVVFVAGCTAARGDHDRAAANGQTESYGSDQEGLSRSYESLSPRRSHSSNRPGEWNIRRPMDSNK